MAHAGKVKLRNHDSNKVKSSKGDQAQKSDAELSPVHGPRTVGEIKAAYKQGKDHVCFLSLRTFSLPNLLFNHH